VLEQVHRDIELSVENRKRQSAHLVRRCDDIDIRAGLDHRFDGRPEAFARGKLKCGHSAERQGSSSSATSATSVGGLRRLLLLILLLVLLIAFARSAAAAGLQASRHERNGVQIGASRGKDLDCLVTSVARREHHGRLSLVPVLRVGICAIVQEYLDRSRISGSRGQHQRRRSG